MEMLLPKGRINQKEFIIGIVSSAVIYFILILIAFFITPILGHGDFVSSFNLIVSFSFIASLVFMLLAMRIATLRLHDIGKSGWITLLLLFPVLKMVLLNLIFYSILFLHLEKKHLFQLILDLLQLLFIPVGYCINAIIIVLGIYLIFTKGQSAPNKYGNEVPKTRSLKILFWSGR